MSNDYVKAASMAAWILAIGAVAYMSGTSSFTGWSLVAVLSLVLPAVVMRFWSAPGSSMSESIQDALR